ncbi:Uncharacterised protein [Streptococcus pneumoniae]|nr:Uncharacterised protein [Streptococcus pneumoniae]COQ10231.1 Uncharacterised protein [Streptococcus pneumoniae]COR52853.1 Uncharacterised protein [Streptococcus pneumoniae]CRF95984.1 Uncharacterised protein [Streptococcus pneumoniae]CRG02337.1 Uncharacterised protein [Streptococcus pneumoniae]
MPLAFVPSGNVTVTVEPGSALPVIVLSSLVTGLTDGTVGAVVSVTTVVDGCDSLPSLSVAVTGNVSPPFRSSFAGMSIT